MASFLELKIDDCSDNCKIELEHGKSVRLIFFKSFI